MRTDTHCTICGTELPPRTSQEGRPRLYCGKDCTNAGYQARRSARRLAARADKVCPTCGVTFTPAKAFGRFCSHFCRRVDRGLQLAQPHPPKTCALPECDVVFVPKRHLDRCCSMAHGRLLSDVESFHKRRAQKLGTATRPVRIDEIAARDKNRCHICRRLVSKKPYPHPLSRSLDHLVPLSKDGEHTPENVRLAHLGCNVSKKDRGGNEQLLLIG